MLPCSPMTKIMGEASPRNGGPGRYLATCFGYPDPALPSLEYVLGTEKPPSLARRVAEFLPWVRQKRGKLLKYPSFVPIHLA